MKSTRKILLLLSFMISSYGGFSQIMITFTVDVTGFPVYPGGVHIAGQFATTNCYSITEEWQPAAPGSLMTLLYDSTYSITVNFPETSIGLEFQWEFVRDSVWGNNIEDPSEGNYGDPSNFFNDSCASGGLDNRLIYIPSTCSEYHAIWNKCAFIQPALPIPVITQNGNTLTSSASPYYQWQLNGQDILGATNQSYEVQVSGLYTVIISNESGCSSSTTLYVEYTGIENLFGEHGVFVFPNPAEDHFTIAFSTQANENATAIITITDALGKQLLQQESKITQGKLREKILLNEQFTTGLYLIRIKVEDGFFTRPLIVQR